MCIIFFPMSKMKNCLKIMLFKTLPLPQESLKLLVSIFEVMD